MNRLSTELQRLYAASPSDDLPAPARSAPLIDAQGCVKALVLELAGPADWAATARLWNGVQAELALPAPAIAVAGDQGYQLWFALPGPTDAARARDFGLALARRLLPDPALRRLQVWPGVVDGATRHARLVPDLLAEGGPWSAFVAADLAPMFADEPWLDLPPNPDGQAKLLAGLRSITPTELADAQALLAEPPPPSPDLVSPLPNEIPAATAALPAPPSFQADARRFLLGVMNNADLAMALRVDAAKALLGPADH